MDFNASVDLNYDGWTNRQTNRRKNQTPVLHLAKTGATKREESFIGINTVSNRLEKLWSRG